MKQSGIYKITCRPNNKVYVGSAVNISVRWKRHQSELISNKHVNLILQNSYNKYGLDVFEFKIIEIVDNQINLFEREQHYLDTLKPFGKYGFNIMTLAQGGGTLDNHPNKEEICFKISRVKRGQKIKVSDEHKAYLSEKLTKYFAEHPHPNKNKTLEEIHGVKKAKKIKKKISENNKTLSGEKNHWFGKSHTKQARDKMSKAHEGKYFGTQNIEIIIDGKPYNSYGQAAKTLDTYPATIRDRCLSKNIKYNNYKIKNE